MSDNQAMSLQIPFIEDEQQAKQKVTTSRRNEASLFSKIFFIWVYGTIKTASEVVIEADMIEELPSKETSDSLYNEFSGEFEKRKDGKHALAGALFITSKKTCIFVFFVMLLSVIVQMCNPIMIKMVIDYMMEADKEIQQGVLLVCGIVGLRFISVVCSAHSMSSIRNIGYDWMAIISLALLKKSMKVSFASNKQHSSGQVLNYMQVDSAKLQWLGWYLSQVMLMPIQLVISLYLMFMFIGYSFLAGLVVIIMTAGFNVYVGRKMMKYQKLLMKDKDERTKCANEIFQQIKFIKVNAFEEFFLGRLFKLREQEIKTLRTRFFIACLNILSVWLSPMLILNATFALYVSTGHDLTPSNTFAIISLFQMLQQPLLFLPMALNALIEADISMKRIEKYLLTDEMMSDCVTNQTNSESNVMLSVTNGTFYWTKSADNGDIQKTIEPTQVSDESPLVEDVPILNNINLSIEIGQFISVVGDVGSGKSSLLQAILGEMLYKQQQPDKPEIRINGTIAYVSQKAWIQNATVKDNIIFGEEYEEDRYNKAIKYSCLKEDIKILIKGDQTMIGEKGVNLSGGQKARVTLARAIYSDADIYLLDDPISAVDVHVGKFIMHECLNGYLKNKTRILVTHALNFCQYTDMVYLMDNGQITESGVFEQIRQSEKFNRIYSKFYKDINKEEEVEQDEDLCHLLDDKTLPLQKQASVMSNPTDSITQLAKDEIDELMLLEDRDKGEVSVNTIAQYFRFNGGLPFFLFLGFMMVLWIGCYIGSSLWMAHWTQVSSQDQEDGVETANFYYLGIYTSFSLSYGVLAFLRSWILVLQSSKSASQLHNQMATSLIYAPLCGFFERVPLGRILNRLTKDQNVLDAELHWTINWMYVQVFLLMANTFLNVYTSSYYVLIPIVLYFYGAWKIQRMYMNASRELYRLEAISKSPILSYFTESIMGMSVVRAFNKQDKIMLKHGRNQDVNRKIFLEQIAINVWFSLVLGLSSFLVNITAIVFCIFYSTKNPAYAGLLMTYASTLDSNISSTVQCLGSMENSMISFERCVAYTKVKAERGYEQLVQSLQLKQPIKQQMIQQWPSEGIIQYKDYSVQYRQGLPSALKNLTFTIQPKQKIGIVGRTGAGKSTITLTLLRILEATKGQIFIDGVDISQISLRQLRESITMIMQDATIFEGTIRDNIDPLARKTDDEVMASIDKCCLKELIDGRDGLKTHINEGGDNLSAGEKQLICIARAVIKKSPIVLIDEATANIDIDTEHKIQDTIQKAFHDCTVITIAHRINTILHCDKIIVIDKGQLKEYGDTKDLLQQKDSVFYNIYQEALQEQKH